ncbi:MAG: hypothetical protein M3N30_13835 [Bacteroidota bacterium]|nr:hypothetical protein [Bacteroidota bacterium]
MPVANYTAQQPQYHHDGGQDRFGCGGTDEAKRNDYLQSKRVYEIWACQCKKTYVPAPAADVYYLGVEAEPEKGSIFYFTLATVE